MKIAQLDRYKQIPLEQLVKADWNYKTDNPQLIEKLKENMKRNGQIENLLVRQLDTGYYEVVNGNHRFEALADLGVEMAICYDLGKISLEAAMRVAIETNETKFDSDQVKLSKIVKELMEAFPIEELEATMPYSADDLANMHKTAEFTWDQHQPTDQTSSSSSTTNEPRQRYQQIVLNVPEETYNLWNKTVEEARGKLDFDEQVWPNFPARVFEFAVAEVKGTLDNMEEFA